MTQPTGIKLIERVVWRIDADNPLGAFVSVNKPKSRQVPEVEPQECGWRESSLDLLNGVQVSETEMDALTGELIDGFKRVRD